MRTREEWEELSGKIDWEGGIAPYFLEYSSGADAAEFDAKLGELVAAFNAAYDALYSYLDKNGGTIAL